jgi:hypothetical protein
MSFGWGGETGILFFNIRIIDDLIVSKPVYGQETGYLWILRVLYYFE